MASATVFALPRPRTRHILHAIALVVGAVALAILIDRLGREGFERAILGTGRWFLVIAAIDLASVFCDAGGIYCFVRPLAKVSYWRVFAAQASGIAINRLTPGNSLGEPIKITMLMAHVPEAAAVSAVVMFNVASYLVAVSAIAVGVVITLLSVDLPGHGGAIVLLVTATMLALVGGLVVLARRGALATLLRVGRALRLLSAARAETWGTRLAEIDANIRHFGDAATRRALLCAAGSRALNMTGALVILIASGTDLTVPLVAGTLSVGILITWISNVVPLGLGLADGGNYALYGVLGGSPGAGLEFAMINRVRTVVLASMGLAVMAVANVIDRKR
jgi:uncharacterized membrane protein YbhN (UPF0104 family)